MKNPPIPRSCRPASRRPRWRGKVGVAILTLVLCGGGCRTAKVTGQEQLSEAPRDKPSAVYIADFGLLPDEIKDDPGVLSDVPVISRAAKVFLYGQEPPTERARELVELMSTSLVKDVDARGLAAYRHLTEDPMPTNGWLIRGVYTKVQEGNRLRRSMIGFGAGETEVQILTVFNDLSKGLPQPLYQVDTEAGSGRMPGSAPTLILSPYPAAARFVLSGTDLERNVRQTARRIADQLEVEIGKAQ